RRRELEDPADGGGGVDEPELLAPVVRPMLEVHHREPRGAVHERDVAEIHDDVEPLRLADQVIERRDRRDIEAPGQAQVCGAVGRHDANREDFRGNQHRGSLPGGTNTSRLGASLWAPMRPVRQAPAGRGSEVRARYLTPRRPNPQSDDPQRGRTGEDPRDLAFPGSLRPRRQPWSTGRRASWARSRRSRSPSSPDSHSSNRRSRCPARSSGSPSPSRRWSSSWPSWCIAEPRPRAISPWPTPPRSRTCFPSGTAAGTSRPRRWAGPSSARVRPRPRPPRRPATRERTPSHWCSPPSWEDEAQNSGPVSVNRTAPPAATKNPNNA